MWFGTRWLNQRPLQESWFDNSNLKGMWNQHVPGFSPVRSRHQPTDELSAVSERLSFH